MYKRQGPHSITKKTNIFDNKVIAYIFEDLSRIKILYYLWLILSKGDLSRAKSIITKELDKLEIDKLENKVLSQIDGEDFGFEDKLIIRKSDKSFNLLVP